MLGQILGFVVAVLNGLADLAKKIAFAVACFIVAILIILMGSLAMLVKLVQ